MSTFEPPAEFDVDLGNLAVFDRRIDFSLSEIERATSGAQVLVSAIFSLPSRSTEDGKLVDLPKPTFKTPREKPIPKERELTKWEKFSKEKGIQKKRRDRLVLDEATGEYVPRYGRGSKNALDRDVILPHKAGMEEDADPFAQKRKDKKKRVKENTKKKLSNVGRAQKARGANINPVQSLHGGKPGPSGKKYIPKKSLKDSLAVAQRSTASAGKFDDKLPKEPKQKNQGRKKKFETVANKKNMGREKDMSKKIADRILLGTK